MRAEQKGFSLIELMIALAIVGILSSIAYSAYTGQTQSARQSAVQGELMDLALALESYRSQNFSYANADVNLAVLSPDLAASTDYNVNIVVDPDGDGDNLDYRIDVQPLAGGNMVGTGMMSLGSDGTSCLNETSDNACDPAVNDNW